MAPEKTTPREPLPPDRRLELENLAGRLGHCFQDRGGWTRPCDTALLPTKTRRPDPATSRWSFWGTRSWP